MSIINLVNFRDTVFDAIGIDESEEKSIARFRALPKELRAEGLKHGCDDPDFVTHFREHISNGKLTILMVNTRKLYSAVMQGMVSEASGNGLSLILLRCRNGKFFLEAKKEGEFLNENGISYPFVKQSEYRTPHFFETREIAEQRAIELLP